MVKPFKQGILKRIHYEQFIKLYTFHTIQVNAKDSTNAHNQSKLHNVTCTHKYTCMNNVNVMMSAA